MKKWIPVSAVAAFAIVLAGSLGVSAFGGVGAVKNADPAQLAQLATERFQHAADILGVSIDDVKQAWSEGKTIRDLAQEKGISDDALREKMQAERRTQMQEHLSVLVNQGVITQAQADSHLGAMESREPGEGRGEGPGFGGRHGGMGGFGF